MECIEYTCVTGLHKLSDLIVRISNDDLGHFLFFIIHDTVVELTGILLPACQLLGGGFGHGGGDLLGRRFHGGGDLLGRRFHGLGGLLGGLLGRNVAYRRGIGFGLGVTCIRVASHKQAQTQH